MRLHPSARTAQGAVAVVLLATACATHTPGVVLPPAAQARRSEHWPELDRELTFRLPFRTGTLDANGVRFVILPDPTATLVQVDVRVDAGARDTPSGRAGLAHLVEHLIFLVRPGGGDTVYARLRRASISNNAYTSADSTHFQNAALPGALGDVLAIEAARFSAGCAGLDQAAFARERDVVRNELRETGGAVDGGPLAVLARRIYGADHPYLRSPRGTEAELAATTLADACAFIDAHYAPSRLIVVIAGAADPDQAMALVGEHFGALPARAAAAHAPPPAAAPTPGMVRVPVETTARVLLWGFPVPAREQPGGLFHAYVAPVLAERLGDAFRDDPRVPFATAFLGGGHHAPILIIALVLSDKAKVDEVEQDVEKRLGEVRGLGFSLARRITIGLIFELEHLGARTDLYADYMQFSGRIGLIDELVELSAADRNRSSSPLTGFTRDRAVRLLLEPARPAPSATPPELAPAVAEVPRASDVRADEAKARLVVPSRATLPAARRFTLPNGLEVVLQATPSQLPAATTRLVFRAGRAHEPAGLGGLAQIAGLVFEHGVYRTALAIAGPVARLDGDDEGLEQYLDVSYDRTTIEVQHLDYLTPEVLHDLAYRLNAALDDRPVVLALDLIEALWAAADDAPPVVTYAVDAALYGPDHVYARHIGLTKRSVLAMEAADVTTFLGRHYVAANAILVVAGPFSDAQLDAIALAIRDEFGRWPAGQPTPPAPPEARARTSAVFLGIDTGGADDVGQLEIAVAWPGPAGIDGEQAARLVLSQMIEGRVRVARETLAATYGLSSGYYSAVGPGSYEVRGLVARERAGAALAAVRSGLAALRDPADPGFAADFAVARRTVLAELIGRSATASALARAWAFIALYRLADDYFDKLPRFVASLSPAQVQGLAARELLPEREIVIVAGPRRLVEKAFADAGLPAPRFMKRWPRPTPDQGQGQGQGQAKP